MKRITLLLLGLLAIVETYSQEHTQRITFEKEKISIEELVKKIHLQDGARIYLSNDSIGSLEILTPRDSVDYMSFLNQAISRHGLFATKWQGNILISPKPILYRELHEVSHHDTEFSETDISERTLTEAEQRYLKGRGTDVIESITVGSSNALKSKGKSKVIGVLRDTGSGETLIGATIYIEELKIGAATDLNGILSINIEPGHYNVRFDCVGQKSAKYQLNILSDGEFNLSLERSIMQIDEVLVYGSKSINITSRDAGLEKIAINTLKELPMMLGERDVIKVSELLPGIVTIGEGASGVNVRGGNFDQNGFYINKVPIYNTSHLFGFFPAFNPDVIKDFSIYKGHMPAEYGGRLSSIFNIVTKRGNRKRFNVRGGLNTITSGVTLEGPIIKDAGSVLLSVRTSYSDWILRQLSDPDLRNSSARFGDIILAANLDIDSKNQLSIFSYYSSDHFRLSNINQYTYKNFGGSFDWKHAFSSTIRSDVSFISSQYSFETIDNNFDQIAYSHNYAIYHNEVKGTVTYLQNEKNKIEAGTSLTLYHLSKGNVNPYGTASLLAPVSLGKEKGLEGIIYFSDTYDPFSWLNLYLGIRYSTYAPMGEKETFRYQTGKARDLMFVTDTLRFSNFEPIKWYHGPEIRAAINIKTDNNGSIKFAFNQTRQNVFMLNNTITISPNTQWQLANEYLKPLLGNQISLGIFRDLPRIGSEFSIEAFAKKTQNNIEFKDGATFISTPHIETMVLQGNQTAYGLEFMIKKSKGRLNGWIAYTYSKSLVEVDGKESWMQINQGIAFPSNYDIPHAVNGVFNYRFSRRFNFSTTATYQTGRPITYPLSIYYINDFPIINYSNRNEFRIPDYFRVDLSIAVEGNLKKNKLFHSSWVFGIYNLTGRKNPLSIYFKFDEGKIKGYKYSVIGTPIFTATWVFKLGNYAAD